MPRDVTPGVSTWMGCDRPISIGPTVGELDEAESAVSVMLAASKLEQLTDATLTEPAAIEQEIERSVARGWFANLGEIIPDLAGVAWPLRINGEAYAISVAGPRYRLEPRCEEIAAMLRAACISIEQKS